MASKEDMNPFKKDDRARVSEKIAFFYKESGKVLNVFDNSVCLMLDNGISIVTSCKNLKKLRKS